ncbi:MAG: YegS/Rv2252/BmrU family lipid kinase [Actinomycetota bacterium]|nr:YegS/Rv2252/BmrU family lipid kinase [Actinomycetota bacterium]
MERFSMQSFRKPDMKLELATGRSQRYLVVINPVSRGGKAVKEGTWLINNLRKLNVKHDAFFTETPGHAEKIVRRWLEYVDVVVVVGGDGTINEVVNGMLSAEGCSKQLAVFPAGTADDFCNNVGIPRNDRKKALEILLTDRSRTIDLIKVNDRYAVVSTGVGVDAEIAYKTLSHKSVRIAAYFAVGLRLVFIERFRNSQKALRITSEHREHEGKFLIAVFGNAPLYARYVFWMPEAKMDDGIINMSALGPMSPLPAWLLFLKCWKQDYRSEKVIYDSSSSYKVEFLEDSFIQTDGEVYRYNTGEVLNISTAPKALSVRMPDTPPEGHHWPFVESSRTGTPKEL